ncbi:NepR family anti-sigma factor [Methylocystis echinoides]|uniref:Anti-sigma factor NepR domain-containing protein n=1 Tax=Methylocystis echinoides TaxID=29468 RepID=A0A9W6GT29_9HYPH|nr:NepR family anti-sigma factor [Methylocystis echinoides]GLI92395.1 hypothetical protein LMG27198_13870 [Methylocystis echinoides]
MNLLEFGTTHRGKSAKAPKAARPYDNLAGAEMMRRAAKARGATLRGDQHSTLLASRRANESQDRLCRQLKDYYQTMLREPVPDRILALVEALDARQHG